MKSSLPTTCSFLITLVVSILITEYLVAQPVISQHVFAVAGHSNSTPALTISSTLGETFIFGGNTDDVYGCQGFQSGIGTIITSVISAGDFKMKIQYFPNPTSEGVRIQWDQQGEYFLEIRNTLGQSVAGKSFGRDEHEAYFDLREYPDGMYGLFFSNKQFQSFFAGWVMLHHH